MIERTKANFSKRDTRMPEGRGAFSFRHVWGVLACLGE